MAAGRTTLVNAIGKPPVMSIMNENTPETWFFGTDAIMTQGIKKRLAVVNKKTGVLSAITLNPTLCYRTKSQKKTRSS